MRPNSSSLRSLLVIALALASCAGQSWEQVREQDTPAAYRRFLADHPSSPHAAEAKERIAVLQLERDPTAEALARFQQRASGQPGDGAISRADSRRASSTPPVPKRRPPPTTASSRASPTANSRRALAATRSTCARAASRDVPTRSRPSCSSTRPVTTRPRRSGRSPASTRRSAARLGAVGLRIEIAAGVGEADRLRNLFAERARETYAAAGIPLVDGAATRNAHDPPRRARGVGARSGRPTREVGRGRGDHGVVAAQRRRGADLDRTVQRAHPGRRHVARADPRSSPTPPRRYWERFFVPIASWPTQLARRSAWNAGSGLAGVTADVGRAIALSPNGSFRELDLSDPSRTARRRDLPATGRDRALLGRAARRAIASCSSARTGSRSSRARAAPTGSSSRSTAARSGPSAVSRRSTDSCSPRARADCFAPRSTADPSSGSSIDRSAASRAAGTRCS